MLDGSDGGFLKHDLALGQAPCSLHSPSLAPSDVFRDSHGALRKTADDLRVSKRKSRGMSRKDGLPAAQLPGSVLRAGNGLLPAIPCL